MVIKKSTKPQTKKTASASVAKVSRDIKDVLGKIKTKYTALDPDTKKKIVASVATVAALLAARAAVKKITKRRD